MKKIFFFLILVLILSSLIPVFAHIEHYAHGGMAVSASSRYRRHYGTPPPPPPPPPHRAGIHHPPRAVYHRNFNSGYNPADYCKFRVTYNESYCYEYNYPYRSPGAYIRF